MAHTIGSILNLEVLLHHAVTNGKYPHYDTAPAVKEAHKYLVARGMLDPAPNLPVDISPFTLSKLGRFMVDHVIQQPLPVARIVFEFPK